MELLELPEWGYSLLMLFCVIGALEVKQWHFKIMLIILAALFWFQAYEADLVLHSKVIQL